MLQELRISNFRLFDDEVSVRFRPITVFIGRNNSGKSSILKFLLMLQQSLEVGSPDLLRPEGARVNLGGFTNLKNSISEKQALRFELTVNDKGNLRTGLRGYLESAETKKKFPNMQETDLLYATLDFPGYFQSVQQDQSESRAQCDMIEVLRQNISTLQYLHAARAGLQSVIEDSVPPGGNVGQDGRYTLPHLRRLIGAPDSSSYDFLLPHIRTVAGIEDIEFDGPQEFSVRCYATDKVTGAKSCIGHFGLGASQCLPVFVQGAIMPRYACLIVEEPEAQLHPTAQLDMGSFFADLWNKRKVGSIIETHSDNVLLRLRRLVANGTLSTDDVSVAYFTHDEEHGNMPIVKNLDIGEGGSIEKGLPMKFFGQNVDEVLNMAVGK